MHAAALMLLVSLCYGHTLDAPFDFDDRQVIVSNPLVKDLDYFVHPERARQVFEHELTRYKTRYVGLLSFALNYRLHGISLSGYHMVNISIHMLCVLAVYALCISLFGTPALAGSALWGRRREVALLASALFATHPIQTQAVTYIVQRLTSLSALFYISSVLFYVRGRLAASGLPRWGFISLSILCAALGMKTKEIAFTLPFALCLVEFACFRESIKQRLKLLAPYALTLLIIPLSLMSIDKPLEQALIDRASRLASDMPRVQYMATEARVMMTYLRLLVLPARQNIDYDYPVYPSFCLNEVALSVAVLVGLCMLAAGLMRAGRDGEPALVLCGLGLAWYFLALSVESSLIPIADVIFEHRVYLPLAGMSIAIATAVGLLYSVTSARRARAGIVVLCVLVVAGLSVATHQRNSLWLDSVSLWSDTARKSPNKARVVGSLAYVYEKAGRKTLADEYYRKASRMDWSNSAVQFNSAVIAMERADYLSARRGFTAALRLKEDLLEARKFIDYLDREGHDIKPGAMALHPDEGVKNLSVNKF